jgi:hypothetical protein
MSTTSQKTGNHRFEHPLLVKGAAEFNKSTLIRPNPLSVEIILPEFFVCLMWDFRQLTKIEAKLMILISRWCSQVIQSDRRGGLGDLGGNSWSQSHKLMID